MREDISEPQHWRHSNRVGSVAGAYWSARRQASAPLSPEAVDAAFADESIRVEPIRGSRRDPVSDSATDVLEPSRASAQNDGSDLVQSISAQLAMLEAQREQLQRLLAQAQDSRG